MTTQPDHLITFPSIKDLNKVRNTRRNRVIYYLGAYLTKTASESQTPKQCGQALFGIATGERDVWPVFNKRFKDIKVYKMDHGSLNELERKKYPRPSDRDDPWAILMDALVVGIAWANPTSPSIEKMLDVLEIVKLTEWHSLEKDISAYVKRAGRYIDAAVQSITNSNFFLVKEGIRLDRVEKDILIAHELILAKLGIGALELRVQIIKTWDSCIDLDRRRGQPAFLRALYRDCTALSYDDPRELWESLLQSFDISSLTSYELWKVVKAMREYSESEEFRDSAKRDKSDERYSSSEEESDYSYEDFSDTKSDDDYR